ncbi:MAG: hypothetical protein EB168_10765 [Euryarchaeota archaeon]|nr:hypothetical protein [Euryarchaeota archaeon]
MNMCTSSEPRSCVRPDLWLWFVVIAVCVICDQVSKAAPDLVCVDLHDGDSWVAWEDASISEDAIDSLQRFRWIVAVD